MKKKWTPFGGARILEHKQKERKRKDQTDVLVSMAKGMNAGLGRVDGHRPSYQTAGKTFKTVEGIHKPQRIRVL